MEIRSGSVVYRWCVGHAVAGVEVGGIGRIGEDTGADSKCGGRPPVEWAAVESRVTVLVGSPGASRRSSRKGEDRPGKGDERGKGLRTWS